MFPSASSRLFKGSSSKMTNTIGGVRANARTAAADSDGSSVLAITGLSMNSTGTTSAAGASAVKNCRATCAFAYATVIAMAINAPSAASQGGAIASLRLSNGMMMAADRSATVRPVKTAAARPLAARIARSIAIIDSGTPRAMARTPATAVTGGVLRAAKNSGLFATTSKIGCAIPIAPSARNAAPRSHVSRWRVQ